MSRWQQIAAGEAVLEREIGTVHKDPGGKLRVALAYPNSYYVGMSSLALQILYRIFNARPDVACERVFWDPAAAAAGEPLVALESATDLVAFDVWAFTVSFEMDYFHIAAMLEQAGVPAMAEERARGGFTGSSGTEERWPLLLAGGPAVTMNPEPLAPFFDALVMGEAEEIAGPLLELLADGARGDAAERERLLDALDRLPGVYVPSRAAPEPGGRRIARRWVADVATLEPVQSLYTPDTEFAGMQLMEIARGCGRGCRYCLAGYLYRPPREQPAERILEWARAILRSSPETDPNVAPRYLPQRQGQSNGLSRSGRPEGLTPKRRYTKPSPRSSGGWRSDLATAEAADWQGGAPEDPAGSRRGGPARGARETRPGGKMGSAHGGRVRGIGLVAAAVSDHSQIDGLAEELQAMGARISVSSMRTDPLSIPLLRALAASGTQTLTIAPEAGSERLRRVINKPQSEDSLLGAVEQAQLLGFPQLKMYYMIGHPTETDEDIQGIVDLTLKARAIFRRNVAINATPFVPKAHTPFQRVGTTPAKTLQDRQNALARALERHNVTVKADSPAWAEVQAVLSRGDRRLAPVLVELAPRVAAGQLNIRAFHEALRDQRLNAEEFLGERSPGAFLPWQIVESGVSEKYLAFEGRLAGQGRAGHSCFPTTTGCRTCGLCED